MDDGGSFEAWYRVAHPRLLASLTLVTRDRAAAEDIAAEACSRCLQRWDDGNPPDDPSAWTYTVAVNLARRTWRRRQRERELLTTMVAPASLTSGEPELELWRAVADLPDRARLAVVLRYLGGLGEAEIGSIMGIAPGTVAATLSKARTRLGAALEADGLGPRASIDAAATSQEDHHG